MREKDIEKTFTNAIKKAGGIAPKLVSPGTAGMPDRIVLFRGARVAFVELKQRGEKPRPIQVRRHDLLRDFGFPVYIVDSTSQIPEVINAIRAA